MDDLRLWKDPANARWYRVPPDVTPREGPHVLVGLDDIERGFDPTEITGWEMSDEDAQALVRSSMEQVLERGLASFGAVVQQLGGKPLDLNAPDGGADALTSALSAFIGALAAEVGDDPEQRVRADATLRTVARQIGEAVGQPAEVESAAEKGIDWLRDVGAKKPSP